MMGRRVLVTGGSGFIGSYVVRDLQREGATVTVISHKLERQDDVDTVTGDICMPGIRSLICAQSPEIVVHLAAQPGVLQSQMDPVHDAMTNIVGTVNVVDAAIQAGATRVILASSGGTVYGQQRRGHRIRESTRREPTSPYGLSKATADAYLAQLAPKTGLSLTIGNVYGPGDPGVIARFVSAIQLGDRPRIYGDGSQTRDFVHVTDVAAAIVRACSSEHTGSINIGSGRATSIAEVVRIIADALGREADPVYLPWIDGDVRHTRLDITRARKLLGWKPKVDLATGIRQLVASSAAMVLQAAGSGTRWLR